MRVIPFERSPEIIAAVPLVVAHLRQERVIAYPTETVYGLGCILSDAAIGRLRLFKPRAAVKTFLLLVDGLSMVDERFHLSDAARRFAATHWPGPLTLVLRPRNPMPDGVTSAAGGVAVRWTSHDGAQRIIRALGDPITSTSANRPGLPTAATAQEIERVWRRRAESETLLILDGGALADAMPSTIVDCTGERPRVIRTGAIDVARLRATVHELDGEG